MLVFQEKHLRPEDCGRCVACASENPAVWGMSKSGRTNGCWSLAKVLGWDYYPLLMSKELSLSGFRSTQEQVVVREFRKAKQ